MFAHKEVSHKLCGPTCSENTRRLLAWVYCERCLHILNAFWAYYTQYLCWFCTRKLLFSAITPCHVLIGQNVKHASERRLCVLRTWLRFTTERIKKKFKNFKKFKNKWSRGFLWKVRVKIYIQQEIISWSVTVCLRSSICIACSGFFNAMIKKIAIEISLSAFFFSEEAFRFP